MTNIIAKIKRENIKNKIEIEREEKRLLGKEKYSDSDGGSGYNSPKSSASL